MSRLIHILTICVVSALPFGAVREARSAPDVTFSDGAFADADWSASVFTFNHPGATASQATSGGNPGSHRAITTLQANLGESRVVIIEMRTGAVVDPSVLGGIAGIDYAEDQKCASADGCAGLGQGWAPALRQGGKFYIVSPPSTTTGVLPGWVSVSNMGLGAASFSEVLLTASSDTDSASHPDFSPVGGSIELGYARTNRKNSLRTGRLDNWSVTVIGAGLPTGIGDDRVPDTGVSSVALLPNYPNPFNPSTTIRYELAQTQSVQLAIYDAEGRLVRSLVNRVEPGGVRQVTWQGRDRDGNAVSSGIYFVRLTGQGQTVTRKIVLIK